MSDFSEMTKCNLYAAVIYDRVLSCIHCVLGWCGAAKTARRDLAHACVSSALSQVEDAQVGFSIVRTQVTGTPRAMAANHSRMFTTVRTAP